MMYTVAYDTVFYHSPVGTDVKLTRLAPGEDEKVLDQVCKSYYIEIFDPLSPPATQHQKYQYFVDPKLSINPDWSRSFTEGEWDKVMATLKGIPLKYTLENDWFKQTTTATSVDRIRVKSAEFRIDDHLPRKELQ
ncbi:MAG: hypothetical protein ICV84_11495 [Flavisolibacter sp.]|nr:hypothetical protein [Flavisolibacter sp.]